MKFTINNKPMKCLFTCHHVIEQQDIENERNIFIFYGKKLNEENRTIKLEKSKRFMKTYKKEDTTLIEILNDDNINEDKYLTPDLNYKSGYIQYANKNLNYFMAGYPANRNERCISSGSIKSINYYYEFIHKLDTRPGSSGSPIVNDNCDVIGIHHSGYQKLKQNYGTFIGKVLDNLENEFFFPNNPNMIKYNDFYLPENRNIIPEINNCNNYIIGEIYINENQINQSINIINYGDKNKKEIENNCLIKIDDINIQFSSTYTFTTCGIHKIKYKFKHTINSAKKLFFDCGSIIKLDFSNFKTQNINDMSQMFEGCISLKDLNLSNFNTKNVTNMAGMFRECKSLINLNLSHFDTTNVTNMVGMFYLCESLIDLNLINFSAKKVTNTLGMFFECKSLSNLNLSNFDTTNISNMSFMFYKCESLKECSILNFVINDDTKKDSIFFGCNNELINALGYCVNNE